MMKNMEQDEVLDHLNDQSSIKKLETLKQLQLTVKRNGGRLPWEDPWTIFRGLDVVLVDVAWEVRLKCLHLIVDLIPQLGFNIDSCMFLILKNLILAFADIKKPVRRTSIQAMHLYMKYTNNFEELSKAIVLYGLENSNDHIKKEWVFALPILFTKDLSGRNVFPYVQSLTKIVSQDYNDNLQELAMLALQTISELVGLNKFKSYLHRLPEDIRLSYLRELLPEDRELYSDLNDSQEYSLAQPIFHTNQQRQFPYQQPHPQNSNYQDGQQTEIFHSDDNGFGVFPQQIIAQILRLEDGYRLRAPAVERVKGILHSLSRQKIFYKMGPHMLQFIYFVDNLLDDSNFKITTIALEILSILVEKLEQDAQHFLKHLVSTLARRLGNNKIVIRQGIMKVTIKLMQNATPKLVLGVMLDNLRHKNSRVRQDMINILIAALLTFPSYEFDLYALCKEIVPLLTDSKRNVRRAALECVAVIAQAMGQGRHQPLFQVVDLEESRHSSSKGLMIAVQARLARRHLPRLDEDGLVDYAMPAPSSAAQRKITGDTQNADIEWVQAAASGGSSSARYESVENENVSINESSSASSPDDYPVVTKRFLSAGKGKNKLPWEGDEKNQQNKLYDDLPSSAPTQPTKLSDVGSRKSPSLPGTDAERLKLKKAAFVVGSKENSSDLDSKDKAFWASSKSHEDLSKHSRSKLFPINTKDVDDSPIPMKPALARGSASSRSCSSSSSSSRSEMQLFSNSPDINHSSYTAFGTPDEMQSSLKNIRDSASKRRAERLEKSSNSADMFQSLSSSEREHWSDFHDKKDDLKKKDSLTSKLSSESLFDAKPNLTRNNSIRSRHQHDYINENIKVSQSPDSSSVTRSHSKTSEVCVFGKGYAEDSYTDIKAGGASGNKMKHQKRASKGLNPVETNLNSQMTGSEMESFEHKLNDTHMGSGVHGISIANSTKDKLICKDSIQDNSDIEGDSMREDFTQISTTKPVKERGTMKKRKGDKTKQPEIYNKIQLEVLPVNSNPLNLEKTCKPTPSLTPKIKPKTHILDNENNQALRNSSDLTQPPENSVSLPPAGIDELQQKLNQEDWKIKCEALNSTRQLCKQCPSAFDSGFHPLMMLITKELENLRSQVKRDAILCVTDMFLYLKRRMDAELDKVIGCLLALMAVSKEFIRNDVEKAFDAMVENITCTKALPILITKGLKHRSVGIRKTASYYITVIAKKIGHRRLLSGVKDLTDKILQATLDCLTDPSNEVRYHGKEILFLLMENPSLEQQLEKYLPSESINTMKSQIENLNKKGLVEMSYDISSAPHSAKSLSSSRTGSAASLVNVHASAKRPISYKNIEMVQEEIKEMNKLLSANDWRVRQKGLENFKELCDSNPNIIATNITQIFDNFLPRLQDANSKVNLLALKILLEVIPIIYPSMGQVINLTVNYVSTNLSSKNLEIHNITIKILDLLIHCLEPSILLRPFTNQVTSNARKCSEIIPKIAELVEKEYKLKPKQMEMYILPLVLHLINCVSSSATVQGGSCNLRRATTHLICILNQQMGHTLMDKFSQLVGVTTRHQQYLQDVLPEELFK
ncbi:TOG array regulator of axonemal microtubules protein 1-like isoform X3 [Octopus sinensis]|uniref:TOG array regulator of axonemal microtubules protein 1-like isoform X3 n=1 Tax=Octopus sinensis TaxID=2607531 RepID=A0A7E6FJB2_9MOLL|nr:TOG array regulator of axonemal microtubules protein 1-like isoform X3 [Octopus sinensis]